MADQMTPEMEKTWREIVAKCWTDNRFKQSLMDNPNKVIADAGIQVPGGVNFVVVENEPGRIHLVLPAAPAGDTSVSPMDQGAVSDYDPGF